MEHWPYAKIPESFRAWGLEESHYREISRYEWIATEKVHGANFAIHFDGTRIACAKRKAMLGPGEDFFGHSLIIGRLEAATQKIFESLPGITQLSIYGELFGGEYPHPEVQPDPRVGPVQTGVAYSPTIEYIVFDIALTEGENRRFLDLTRVQSLCEEAGLLSIEPLKTGSFEEMLDYPMSFPSTIPARLGLPPIADNLAEGIVIRPAKEILLDTGKGPFRPILKRKIEGFAEDARYAGAKSWDLRQGKTKAKSLEEILEQEVLPLLTESRMENAISKIGRPGKRNRSRILNEFLEDVIATLKENDHFREELREQISTYILQAGKKLLRKKE